MSAAVRTRTVLLLAGLALTATCGSTDIPLQWKGQPTWREEAAYCRLFDTHTIVTVKGIVQRVEKRVPIKGLGTGVYLILKTELETIPVHLGPAWYVDKQSVQLRGQDVVEVTGSRVLCDGKPVLLASSVKKGEQLAKYREKGGVPAWIHTPR